MRPAIPDGTNIIKVRPHAKPVKYRRDLLPSAPSLRTPKLPDLSVLREPRLYFPFVLPPAVFIVRIERGCNLFALAVATSSRLKQREAEASEYLRDVNPDARSPVSPRRCARARVRVCVHTQWADVYGAFDDVGTVGIRLVLLMSIRQLLTAGMARYLARAGRRGELPVSTLDGFERAFNPACASGKDGLPARFADNRFARDSIPNFDAAHTANRIRRAIDPLIIARLTINRAFFSHNGS